MDDREFNDRGTPEFARTLLKDARINFPVFYRTATSHDAWLMDGLVICRATLATAINGTRDHVVPEIRDGLDKSRNEVERLFMDARECVRACPSFVALVAAEKAEIERTVASPTSFFA